MMLYIIQYEHNAYSVRSAIVFPLSSVFVWTGENDSNTLRVDAYFFENGGKKIFVIFKQNPIRVDGARVSNANDFENIKNYA